MIEMQLRLARQNQNRTIPARPANRRQRGMALAVSLILLVVVTLIGLAAVRATTSQQKMSANFFDRELAFQNAEAGLREGASSISNVATGIRNCGPGGVACEINPFADVNLDEATAIKDAAAYTKGEALADQPQYVVENMGNWNDPDTDTGYDQTANAAQYGAQGMQLQSTYYRVTARSGDPAESANSERSVVTLQAMYKR